MHWVSVEDLGFQSRKIFQITNRLNQITRITFDKLNRPTLTEYLTDGTTETTTYDPYGNKATASNGTVSYTFTYDDKNRLLSKTDSRSGKHLNFGYDAVDNLITKTDYQNETTDFQYDSTNRLVSMRNPAYLKAIYQYDPAGKLLTRVLSDGVSSTFSHDAGGRLTSLMMLSANNSPITNLSYTRDRRGRITQASGLFGAGLSDTRTYTYNARYQLTAVGANGTANDESFTYDGVGNRLTHTAAGQLRTYQYLANSNRLSTVRLGGSGGTIEKSFIYDDEGRLTTQTGQSAKTLAWDQKNRAKQMISGTNTNTFNYDPMDYRIGRSGGTLGNRDYYLEGEHLEAEYQNNALLAKYFRGLSTDELVAGFTSTGGPLTPSLYHHDQLTSVTGVTAHDGQSQQGLVYSAFGETQTLTGTSTNRLRYTGRELDPDTSLYYYRARYYDPSLGRFISEDPKGFEAGDVNFYAYCANNPINHNDPTGLEVGDWWDIPANIGRAREIANRVRVDDAPALAAQLTSDRIQQGNLLLNGQVDAWRHAEWMRRTSDEIGPVYAWTIGVGHEVANLYDKAAGNDYRLNQMTWGQTFQESLMDLSNNRVGITEHIQGASSTNLSDPRLTYGIGGFNGQPDISFGDYARTNAIQPAFSDFGNMVGAAGRGFLMGGAAGGGFLLYPNKANLNMMRSVYAK